MPAFTSPRIRSQSAWNAVEIGAFLDCSIMPLRLACNAGRGFPLLNSLWFEYRDESLWCATHASSAILRFLAADPRCAFEISPNDPPYFGVRGQASAELSQQGAAALLHRLIARYLGDSDRDLATWLLSRVEDEWVLRLRPHWLSAWDYRPRMQARDT